MVRSLIHWALDNQLIVLLVSVALSIFGLFAFFNVNVEAYPDPAPAIIEVIAQYPGASAEEVERQVTIPLEVTLAGMPGLKNTRSKSLFGLSHLRNQFEYGVDYKAARQEVINRLQFADHLPDGVNADLSPTSPTGEIFRYTLHSPKDSAGNDIYTLNDLKALQDWTLERQFRRVQRIAGVTSSGGMVKRYEIQPDPDLLKRYGVTLQSLAQAIGNSNANVGGDFLAQGNNVLNVRGLGLIGGGQDPMNAKEVLSAESTELDAYLSAAHLTRDELVRLRNAYLGEHVDPPLDHQERERLAEIRGIVGPLAAMKAAAYLREEENRRLTQIRQVVISSVNNVPFCVKDVVSDGSSEAHEGSEGVIVGHQTRLGKVSLSRPEKDIDGHEIKDADGHVKWIDEEEKVQGIVLLRKNESSLLALHDVEDRVAKLNKPGRLLPGVRIEPYYDRTELIGLTTETVRENMLLGMALVTVILLMFLSNVRSALIVAVNIPLALLFAFSLLYARGKSANLLSIGAVDFGIIVDSSVIMVENIYRHLASGEFANLSLKERIIHACHEVERALFFSTAIMVCAFIPLFTMQGPEGQIFGPMADTYAFALAGALVLAITVSPVLCILCFKNLKPARDNWLVRMLKTSYLRQLERCLRHRGLTLAVFGLLAVATLAMLPALGREFMPQLEEGNLWIRGTFPLNISMDEVTEKVRLARAIMRHYPEVASIVPQIGRPDDGTDPTGFYNVEFFVPLKPSKDWAATQTTTGWRRFLEPLRPRTKDELVGQMNNELTHQIIGVDWNFSQNIRDNVMEALSGVKGDNSIKIIGPDLDKLEDIADQVKNRISGIKGIENVGVFRIMGQPNLEFPIDPHKCQQWAISTFDVENVIRTAVGGKRFSTMIEGEKLFDITLRWPKGLRGSEQAILDIPVDVTSNVVTSGLPSMPATPLTGGGAGIPSMGFALNQPNWLGNIFSSANINNMGNTPRRRLGDVVTPRDSKGRLDPLGHFMRPGASTIYREDGSRLIAVKFSVRGRDLAGAVDEAQNQDRRPVPIALPRRMERRIPGNARSRRAAQDHHSRLLGPDLLSALLGLQFAARCARHSQQCARALDGGSLGTVADRHQFQHLGRRGIRVDLWRGDHGRPLAHRLFQSNARRRNAPPRIHRARRRKASAPDHDDRPHRHLRTPPRRAQHSRRRADPKTARDRGRRGHDHNPIAYSLSDAGAV